jgi:hypothetical protein
MNLHKNRFCMRRTKAALYRFKPGGQSDASFFPLQMPWSRLKLEAGK